MSNVLDIHYNKAVNVYNEKCNFLLLPFYEEWVMTHLNNLFSFNTSIEIVDLGCGNGHFINKFINNNNNIKSCIGVDPYIEWLNVASTLPNITNTLCLNAYDFSKQNLRYSYLLMKEMIHHLDNAILPDLFQGIYNQLDNNGKVVIITRPVKTNYPFFNRIHQLWEIQQPPYEHIIEYMKQSGFNVSIEIKTIPITVQKDDWLLFIRNKTWSVFSMCTEQEMNDGLIILNTELDNIITFNETLIFIVGDKK